MPEIEEQKSFVQIVTDKNPSRNLLKFLQEQGFDVLHGRYFYLTCNDYWKKIEELDKNDKFVAFSTIEPMSITGCLSLYIHKITK